ncbi:hypothetical protein [Tardiphaga sp. 839_C3_N1_4]|uniref:hypothetical protein n=1 Tax=Tardiphaga sp. 839_C3_N1_4 TaxID=3240761 RepID=UPI003F2587FB
MNGAYDGAQTLAISGDLAETIKSYLTVDTTDEVLDLEIYENHLGDRCVAAAVQTEIRGQAVVEGVIVVVRPKPEVGADYYQVDALPETEGPYADFCPERILDILSPTDNSMAKEWRDRCRERLENETGEAPSPSMN